MQRLFSMFPGGLAGVALFVLRISASTTLLVDGTARWSLVRAVWMVAIFALPAAFLCLGLFTPYFSVFAGVLQVTVLVLFAGQDGFHVGVSTLNCFILAVLGPGAYSFDARIFGRRLLSVPPPK